MKSHIEGWIVHDVVSLSICLVGIWFVNLCFVVSFDAAVVEYYWAWSRRHWRKPWRLWAMIPPIGLVLFVGLKVARLWELWCEYVSRRDR